MKAPLHPTPSGEKLGPRIRWLKFTDSNTLTAIQDGGFHQWGLVTWSLAANGSVHRGFVPRGTTVRFSHDGKTRFETSQFRTKKSGVRLVEHATGQTCLELLAGTEAVGTVAMSPDGRMIATAMSDHIVLVWPLVPSSSKPLKSDGELAKRWAALLDTDSAAAWHAMWDLVASGDSAVRYMTARREADAAKPGADDEIRKLINDLGDESFQVREEASVRLRDLGALATEQINAALRRNPSLEAAQRLRSLVAVARTSPIRFAGEQLRRVRAGQVLERIGSPAAKRELERMAGGGQKDDGQKN